MTYLRFLKNSSSKSREIRAYCIEKWIVNAINRFSFIMVVLSRSSEVNNILHRIHTLQFAQIEIGHGMGPKKLMYNMYSLYSRASQIFFIDAQFLKARQIFLD